MTGYASAAAGIVTNDSVLQAVTKPQPSNQAKNVANNQGVKQTNNKDNGSAPKSTAAPANANAFTFGSFDNVPTSANTNNSPSNPASNQDNKNKNNSSVDASNLATHTRDRSSRDNHKNRHNHSSDDSSDGAWSDSKKTFADMVRSK
jgi:hypothetical protein